MKTQFRTFKSALQIYLFLTALLLLSCIGIPFGFSQTAADPGYTVSGQVLDSKTRQPLANVTVFMGRDHVQTTRTDASGTWRFTGLYGTHWVSADAEGWFFRDELRIEASGTANVLLGTPIEEMKAVSWNNKIFTASGKVVDSKGKGLAGVPIFFDNDNAPVYTDANGLWIKHGLQCRYKDTIVISPDCDAPVPESREISESSQDIHFVGKISATDQEENGYVISGRITTQTGHAVDSVTLYFSDGSAPVKTDKYGQWIKKGLTTTVTVTPNKADWTFISPYILVGKPSSVLNFVGTPKNTMTLYANGEPVAFKEPVLKISGKHWLPAQALLAELGYQSNWLGGQTLKASKGGHSFQISLGSVKAFVDGKQIMLKEKVVFKDKKVYLTPDMLTHLTGAVAWVNTSKNYITLYNPESWTRSSKAEADYIKGSLEKDNKKAISWFTKALSADSDYVFAYYSRSLAYLAEKDYVRAEKDLDQAIKRDPQNDIHYAVRARVLYEMKRYEEAVLDYTKAIAQSPRAERFYGRGLCYSWLGQNEKAVQDLEKSLILNPAFKDARTALHQMGVPGY